MRALFIPFWDLLHCILQNDILFGNCLSRQSNQFHLNAVLKDPEQCKCTVISMLLLNDCLSKKDLCLVISIWKQTGFYLFNTYEDVNPQS